MLAASTDSTKRTRRAQQHKIGVGNTAILALRWIPRASCLTQSTRSATNPVGRVENPAAVRRLRLDPPAAAFRNRNRIGVFTPGGKRIASRRKPAAPPLLHPVASSFLHRRDSLRCHAEFSTPRR
jgi:hypothetical protein